MNQMDMNTQALAVKQAARAALWSLLNLTLLPGIGFLALIWLLRKTEKSSIGHYHVLLGIKLNLWAAVVLLVVSALMIAFGGFDSPWTWIYVISYFTLVHTFFIMVAVWALVRAWSAQRLKSD